MIDVHSPHHAVTTWREFLVHLIIITIGLLIALGLEAGVEKLHHLHQRHELEAGLLDEAKYNAHAIEYNLHANDVLMAWLLGLEQDARAMIASGGKMRFQYRPYPVEDYGEPVIWSIFPTRVWDIAKLDSTIALLPPREARDYSTIYQQVEFTNSARDRNIEALNQLQAFENKFASASDPTTPDLGRMNLQQLDEYAGLLANVFQTTIDAKNRLRICEVANDRIVKPFPAGSSLDQQYQSIRNAHPDTYPIPSPGTPLQATSAAR